jgi:hypothetical protein
MSYSTARPFSTSLTRDLLVSVLIGFCITLVVHFPAGVLPPLQQWIVAVVISLSIYATARALFRLLSPWVARSEGIRQKVLVAGIMVVAGPLGYIVGHPRPRERRPAGPAQAVAVPGPRLPLGVRREVEYCRQELTLAPGERLLFLTDGLAEAPTANGEPLGYAAFAELLDGASSDPSEWLDGLLERVRAATSPALEDDWTALMLERVERAAS